MKYAIISCLAIFGCSVIFAALAMARLVLYEDIYVVNLLGGVSLIIAVVLIVIELVSYFCKRQKTESTKESRTGIDLP